MPINKPVMNKYFESRVPWEGISFARLHLSWIGMCQCDVPFFFLFLFFFFDKRLPSFGHFIGLFLLWTSEGMFSQTIFSYKTFTTNCTFIWILSFMYYRNVVIEITFLYKSFSAHRTFIGFFFLMYYLCCIIFTKTTYARKHQNSSWEKKTL